MTKDLKQHVKVITIEDCFYLTIPITGMWHNFFCSIESFEDENNCEELFIKKVVKSKEIMELIKIMHKRTM